MAYRVMKSERLEYRLVEECDRESFRSMLSQADLTVPTGYEPLIKDEDFNPFFKSLVEDKNAVSILLDGQLIGYLRTHIYHVKGEEFEGKKSISFGFAIDPKYQNKGYGTEMLNFLTQLFLKHYDFIFCDAFTDNDKSNRLIQKCGYKFHEDYYFYFAQIHAKKTVNSYYIGH